VTKTKILLSKKISDCVVCHKQQQKFCQNYGKYLLVILLSVETENSLNFSILGYQKNNLGLKNQKIQLVGLLIIKILLLPKWVTMAKWSRVVD